MLLGTRALVPERGIPARGIRSVSAVLEPPAETLPFSAPAPSADTEGQLDLNGNDVTDAVATYRFGSDGSLYESHSPQTELPKLGPPKS